MSKTKDTLQSWRLGKQSLILTGKTCELAVPYTELSAILEALGKELPTEPRQGVAVVGWSGSRQRKWLDFVKQEQPHAEL